MKRLSLLILALATGACSAPEQSATVQQSPDSRLAGEVMAVAYSGYPRGPAPGPRQRCSEPADAEILEDLKILVANNFRLIRLYDTGANTASTLRLIHENDLPIRVLLGIWLRAEVSNHDGCPWLDEPIPGRGARRKRAGERGGD